MKIFISWSGKRSHGVATALREWLPFHFPNLDLFVSSEDIRKGKRWPLEVSKELDSSKFGIVCLTPDNLEAPWLLFEAGALSKSVKEASVFTLLTGGVKSSDVGGPLSHFQHTVFERDDFFKLVKAINDAQEQAKQEETRLRKIFDKLWDELESNVAKAVKAYDSKPEKTRSPEDMLQELLEVTRHIARNIPPAKAQQPETAKEPQVRGLTNFQDSGNGLGIWKEILERIGKASPFAKSYFEEAEFVTYNDDTLTIYFLNKNKEVVKYINNEKSLSLLQRTMTELGYPEKLKVSYAVLPDVAARKME